MDEFIFVGVSDPLTTAGRMGQPLRSVLPMPLVPSLLSHLQQLPPPLHFLSVIDLLFLLQVVEGGGEAPHVVHGDAVEQTSRRFLVFRVGTVSDAIAKLVVLDARHRTG